MAGSNEADVGKAPLFLKTLHALFPGSRPLDDYIQLTCRELNQFGFDYDNTLGVVAACRDEIAEPLFSEVVKNWGKTFDFRSLGGFLLAGKSGIATVLSHAPFADGKRRFVFYAMPHVAISQEGEVGTVFREGIGEVSHACGSLSMILHELRDGKINFQIDLDDIEQCIVRQKILSALRYGEHPDHAGITKLACTVITDDLQRLHRSIDYGVCDHASFTGVLIHGPGDTHWVCPHHCHVTKSGTVIPMSLPAVSR